MTRLKCKIYCHSVSVHTKQIYTGFFMLYKMGIVDLAQVIVKEKIMDGTKKQDLRDAKHAHIRVTLNDGINLHYDTHDSQEIDEAYLYEADYYFKRSYSSEQLQDIGDQRRKIHPLGLNYLLYPTSLDWFGVQREVVLSKGIKKLEAARYLYFLNRFIFTPDIHHMWSAPNYYMPPKILFMVRTWNPDDNPGRLKVRVEERMEINEMRAQCIKILRKEFGENFYGGFNHTEFAKKNYKEYLMPENKLSSKKNYINLLKSYPICVATTGLYGSIGYKFAEYVAFSKAILSEKLNNEVPGNLMKDKNYLEFNSPEECVQYTEKLFSDKELRSFIMNNNAKYYHSHLRPDVLILNTLLLAISEQ
jgi:hypothetical protein